MLDIMVLSPNLHCGMEYIHRDSDLPHTRAALRALSECGLRILVQGR